MIEILLLMVLSGLSAAAADATSSDFALTEAEMQACRFNVTQTRENTGVALATSGNTVTPLVDGQRFFSQLFADLEATREGDLVHATVFEVAAEFMLLPDPQNKTRSKESALLPTLLRALARGVTLRLLVNMNLYLPYEAILFCSKVNAVCSKGKLKDCCVPETRHSHPSGSLHAKQWIIQRHGEMIAFSGSQDVYNGRYDTPAHKNGAARHMEDADLQPFWGWHGNMFMYQGPAVVEFARTFFLHWTSPHVLPPYRPNDYLWREPAVALADGPLRVQLLRTLSCRGATEDNYYQSLAPHGEYSYTAAYLKAIARARKFIYISDQFAFDETAMKAVAAALPRVERVVLLTDDAVSFKINSHLGFNISAASDMRYYHQRLAMAPLFVNSTLAAKVTNGLPAYCPFRFKSSILYKYLR